MFLLGVLDLFEDAASWIFVDWLYDIAPIAYPIAKVLDYVLGAEGHHLYKKAELKSFLEFHRSAEEPLRDEEISILNGVLELNNKHVEAIMTPLRVYFILSNVQLSYLKCADRTL